MEPNSGTSPPMTSKLCVLAAGGTGGHMFPAEALARELADRGWRIVLATDRRGEAFAAQFPAEERLALDAATGTGAAGLLRAGLAIAGGVRQARRAFGRLKPDIVVGFGGYPSAPAILAALSQGRATMIHEQNAVLGRTNRLLAGRVKAVASAFPTLEKASPAVRARARVVGIPVRPEIAALHAEPYPTPVSGEPIELLVTGGSQGARILAEVVPHAVLKLPRAVRVGLKVTQQVRPENKDVVMETYIGAQVTASIAPFFPNMAKRLKAAHLVIGRAGASTCAELAIAGRPAVLVPLGIATDDHQSLNARLLADVDAALVVPEAEFTAERLAPLLERLLTDRQGLARRAAAARAVGLPDAARALADMVETTAARA